MKSMMLIAILLLSFAAQADEMSEAKVKLCVAVEKMAQAGRNTAIVGERTMLISYIRSSSADAAQREMNEKVVRWGFAFQHRTKAELQTAFMEACMAEFMGPYTMVTVRNR